MASESHPAEIPVISSPGTRRLADTIAVLRRRRPHLDDELAAIRGGNNQLLLTLVRRAQHGDPDAAVVVVWALLPRLCGYFRSCLPVEQWRQAVDECLALNYLTVCDVSMAEKPEFLLHKLITRTRQRYERAVNARRPVPVDNEQLNATTPSIHDVEQQAIARVELDQLRHAVADGIVSPRCWQALVATRLDPTDRITSGADRMAAMRAHRALTAWRDAAA